MHRQETRRAFLGGMTWLMMEMLLKSATHSDPDMEAWLQQVHAGCREFCRLAQGGER
jgi:hypothetical protein